MNTFVEKIADVPEWDNGSNPLWGRTSSIIARIGDDVVVSLPVLNDKLTNLSRLNPALYVKTGDKPFRQVYYDAEHFTREPMPLIRRKDGSLTMTMNPMLGVPRYDGPRCGDPSRPEMLHFAPQEDYRPMVREIPIWPEALNFTEHSYRSSVIDTETDELLLVNQFVEDGQGKFAWTYYNGNGEYVRGGRLTFPVRACYGAISLKAKQAHMIAVSDIVEPNPLWKQHKFDHTQRQWDYDFRMLLYKHNRDVSNEAFSDTVCIASRDETCGHIMPKDVFVDRDNICHVLYTTKNIWHESMRDAFFPHVPFDSALEYAAIQDGSVICRRVLDCDREDKNGGYVSTAYSGAFHEGTDGSMYVLFSKWDAPGHALHRDGYYLFPMEEGGECQAVALNVPAAEFCLAGTRSGNLPGDTIDAFILAQQEAYYARIDLA